MKVCSKCKKVKSEKEFGRDSHAPDGLRYQCKECVNSSPKKPKKKVDLSLSDLQNAGKNLHNWLKGGHVQLQFYLFLIHVLK